MLDAPPTQNRIVARTRQAIEAHSKPKLYLPIDAVWLFDLKLLRPITYAALSLIVSVLLELTKRQSLRHKTGNECLEECCDGNHQGREIATYATAQCQEAQEERADGKEECDQDEREHKARQVIELVGAVLRSAF